MKRFVQFSEEEMAGHVVAWLQDMDWTVYQEVQRYERGKIADIVATRGKLIWVIETKLSLGFDVLEQAHYWRCHAHYVSVGVPPVKGGLNFKEVVLRRFGIGCLVIGRYGHEWTIREEVKPEMNRRLIPGLREKLRPEHQTWARAGNARGERFSPFKATCRAVAEFVAENPGTSLKQMLSCVSTHYRSTSTAHSALAGWIEDGKVKGVRLERDGRKIKLYPDQVKE